jgi:hypothetical protein
LLVELLRTQERGATWRKKPHGNLQEIKSSNNADSLAAKAEVFGVKHDASGSEDTKFKVCLSEVQLGTEDIDFWCLRKIGGAENASAKWGYQTPHRTRDRFYNVLGILRSTMEKSGW